MVPAANSASRALEVQRQIELAFSTSNHLSITVSVSEGMAGGGSGIGQLILSLIPRHESYICTLSFKPWGFGKSFFGIEFKGVKHTRYYVIDPYRPGVFF